MAPWWRFLSEPKHVGADFISLIVFNRTKILHFWVHQLGNTARYIHSDEGTTSPGNSVHICHTTESRNSERSNLSSHCLKNLKSHTTYLPSIFHQFMNKLFTLLSYTLRFSHHYKVFQHKSRKLGVFVDLGCSTASLCSWFPTFGDNVVVSKRRKANAPGTRRNAPQLQNCFSIGSLPPVFLLTTL